MVETEQRMWFCELTSEPFRRQTLKMVKHTQTVRRQKPRIHVSVFNHFVGLALKGYLRYKR